jgi:hypothetical protein
MSRQAQGPIHHPDLWQWGHFPVRWRQSGHKADPSLPSGYKVENACSYTSTTPSAFKVYIGTTSPVCGLRGLYYELTWLKIRTAWEFCLKFTHNKFYKMPYSLG